MPDVKTEVKVADLWYDVYARLLPDGICWGSLFSFTGRSFGDEWSALLPFADTLRVQRSPFPKADSMKLSPIGEERTDYARDVKRNSDCQ